MAKKFLTLDIGTATIALAEYEVADKGDIKLIKYGTAELAASLESGDAQTILCPALLEIVREKGIRPGRVAVAISGQMVFPKFAAIPAAGGEDKFEQHVRYEVEQNIPFPIDEMVYDRQVLGDTPDGDRSVMIVAAKVDQIESITDALSSVGFIPAIVDVAPMALTNAVRASAPDESCAIILDIGARTTSLVITEGERIYNRSIPIAGNNITREIAQALGCTPEEAEEYKRTRGYVSLGGVAEDEDETSDRISKVCRAVLTRLHAEISRSVNFYRSQQGGGTPVRLYLTGGTALLPQIDRFFAETLQIEVEFFDAFERVAVGPAVDTAAAPGDGALLGSTVGLALHAADEAFFRINLLPPSLVRARAEKAKIPFVAAAAVVLLLALGLVFLAVKQSREVALARMGAMDTQSKKLEKQEKLIKAEQEKVNKAKAEADAVKDLLESRLRAVGRLNAVRESLPRLRLTNDCQKAYQKDAMWVERWEGGKLVIRAWKDNLVRLPSVNGANGKALAPSEHVAAKLRTKNAVIDEQSVRITDMTAYGKNTNLEQFTVELKFK